MRAGSERAAPDIPDIHVGYEAWQRELLQPQQGYGVPLDDLAKSVDKCLLTIRVGGSTGRRR